MAAVSLSIAALTRASSEIGSADPIPNTEDSALTHCLATEESAVREGLSKMIWASAVVQLPNAGVEI